MSNSLSFEQASPAWRWLGINVVSTEHGRAVVDMPCTEDMRNHQGVVHGGMISTLADSAMGRSIATVLPGGERHFGFDLKLSFIAPAQPGETLRATATVLHAGRRTGVAACRVEGPDGRLVATATASFILYLLEVSTASADR
jgi:uncharacterized protein (TIGR00369 family)